MSEAMNTAPDNPDLVGLPLAEASALVRTKKVSPLELTRASLERIAALDKQINAFITITLEDALKQAREAESDILRGEWRGPLHGIPIALKDIIDTAPVRTTAASRVFAGRVPQHDATVVERLRAAGAAFVGKTNLHELAYDGRGIVSAFGPARNPWDKTRITGG